MTTEPTIETTVQDRLQSLTIALVRSVAAHMAVTCDDMCDLDYAGYASSHLEELVILLNEHPEVDRTFEMLSVAHDEAVDLIRDMYEGKEYQQADPQLPLDIISHYKVLAARYDKDLAWLTEIQECFEGDLYFDEEEEED